jgi:magnesium transporter
MANRYLYFTELVGLKVNDLKGRKIGRVRDAAIVPLVDAVRVDRFLVGGGWAWLNIRFDQVKSISFDGIQLCDEQLTPYRDDEYTLRFERDLLDQQIIDAEGRKVVRVTDLKFDVVELDEHQELRVAKIDIGLRSVFRRIVQGMMPRPIVRRVQNLIPPHSISWEVCNIVEPDPQRRLRLNISTNLLEKMHPADLADIVEELGPEEREAIFETIDEEVAAEALSEVESEIQASILESLDPERAADIVEEMAPDEAADVLAEMEEDDAEEILEEMETEPEAEVRELLVYEEDTAGGMMNTEFIELHDKATVADAFAALRGNEDLLETVNSLFILDEEDRLAGVVPIGKLFIASEETPLTRLVNDVTIKVNVDEKRNRITEQFDKYNLMTLPVVDEDGKLEGVITADDIITVLRER